MKAAFASLLALVLAACAADVRPPASASRPPTRIPAAGLRADVDILQHAYESMHPGLYRYNTPAEMSARFDALRRRFDRDRTLESAYLAFSELAATIRCGHTYANFYNQSDAVQDRLFRNANRVPFHFRWIDERMIVVRNFSSDPRLAPGTEIVAIDGIPVKKILRTLMRIARADGSNDAKRRAYLQVQGEDTFEAFDIYLPLYFPQIGSTMQIEARSADRARHFTTTTDAVTYAARLAERPEAATKSADGPAWTLREPAAGIAVLDMPTWALYESKWDWRAYLDETFATLVAHGTRTLIIDLRRNEGGEDVGDVLLAHLADRDIAGESFRRLVRYRKAPDDLVPYLHTWDKSFLDWGAKAEPFDERFYRLTKYDDDGGNVIHPRAPRFGGQVFVLIGPTNSSATFQFAQAAKESGLAKLVGQPTGGNRRGINGGAFFFLALPNSGIELDLPLIGRFPETPRPDAGITPDIGVSTRPADIANGRDVEMEAALSAASTSPAR